MVPLSFLSILLAIMIAERFMYLSRLRSGDITTETIIRGLETNKAVGGRNRDGIHSRLLARYLSARSSYGRIDEGIIEEVAKSFFLELKENLRVIGTLTSLAPLLGLLGTVSGMITTFNVMTIFGTGNAKAMSGGISEAMITTQFGLVVAILGLFCNSVIQRRTRRCERVIKEVGHQILRKFQK